MPSRSSGVVLGDHHAHRGHPRGRVTVTVVGPPGGLSTRQRAVERRRRGGPARPARSRRRRGPRAAAAVVGHGRARKRPRRSARSKPHAAVAPACRATLVSSSATAEVERAERPRRPAGRRQLARESAGTALRAASVASAGRQPVVQRRRVHPADDVAQLDQRRRSRSPGRGGELRAPSGSALPVLEPGQRQAERDQPGLGAVVQVALEPGAASAAASALSTARLVSSSAIR